MSRAPDSVFQPIVPPGTVSFAQVSRIAIDTRLSEGTTITVHLPIEAHQ